ncbi:MAG: hypothetical protein FWG85_01705 [Bacteroidetes bacterium]|nr:hypothetical protein [Bacteroidota bacterium]
MKSYSQIVAVALMSILLLACEDSDNATKVKEKETLQTLSSLEGTEWVHHPDTDPESINWFNNSHNPKNGAVMPDTVVIKFLENGRIDEPSFPYSAQYYDYSYTDPYVSIVLSFNADRPDPSDFNDSNRNSVAGLQNKYNLCSLTIDEPICDPLKCKYNDGYSYSDTCCRCELYYWFLGKVEGDTMHLIGPYNCRDIYLVRRK